MKTTKHIAIFYAALIAAIFGIIYIAIFLPNAAEVIYSGMIVGVIALIAPSVLHRVKVRKNPFRADKEKVDRIMRIVIRVLPVVLWFIWLQEDWSETPLSDLLYLIGLAYAIIFVTKVYIRYTE